MAMPLSEELWRPTSCNCRGRSGLRGGLEAPSVASPGPWAATSPGPSCDVPAEDEDCSGHAVSRLLALMSEWLASEEELDKLRSSPETKQKPRLPWGPSRRGVVSSEHATAVHFSLAPAPGSWSSRPESTGQPLPHPAPATFSASRFTASIPPTAISLVPVLVSPSGLHPLSSTAPP